jgi:proteic killer suppression protein
MIGSFASNHAQSIWEGLRVKTLPLEIQEVARRKLRMLNNAIDLHDLKVPPGNRLEPLKGDWAGHYSIRINNQWRIVFKWNRGTALDVDIVDYH